MLPLQRKQAILDYLSRYGGGAIAELSEMLNVSEMTVRRDLKLLESEGVVRRTHGGAVLLKAANDEPRFEEKIRFHGDLKNTLASYAAKHFVSDGSILILEGGTTATSMVDHLAAYKNLTVITNGLNTLEALKRLVPESAVLCCGGMLRDTSHTFVGPVAEQFFGSIHAHVVFLSASGFTPDQGFTDPNMLEGQVKRAMCRNARLKVMLLDSTKFDTVSLITTFRANDIDIFVTDGNAPAPVVERLRSEGIDVRIADEEKSV